MNYYQRVIRKIGVLTKLSFFGKNLKRYIDAGGDNRFRFHQNCKRTGIIIDVGAFEGEFTKFHMETAEQIICFETHSDAVAKLNETFGVEKKVVVCPFGISRKDTRGYSVGSGPGAKLVFDDAADIIIRNVRDVFKELGVVKIDLIKINIEGGEFELIEALHEFGMLDKIEEIHVQTHDFADEFLDKTLHMHRLLSEKFELIASYPLVWDFWLRKK